MYYFCESGVYFVDPYTKGFTTLEYQSEYDLEQYLSPESLGGKGYGLCAFSLHGFRVPPGFVIPVNYFPENKSGLLTKTKKRITHNLDLLSGGRGFTPLVSVRSGAPVSMPGMMDTILNVGITRSNLPFWKKRLGPKTAYECRARLIKMFAEIIHGYVGKSFTLPVNDFSRLSSIDLRELAYELEYKYKEVFGVAFPETIEDQVYQAVEAIYKSWDSDKARTYRKIHDIPDSMGTAVVIQRMVFGNLNDSSGTGVCFSRDPNTGEKVLVGEVLIGAQGEDIVSGQNTPVDVRELRGIASGAYSDLYDELKAVCDKAETIYKDMVDIEFTIENGKLYVLQVRSGKRSRAAKFRILKDLCAENVLSVAEVSSVINAQDFIETHSYEVGRAHKNEYDAQGIPSSGNLVEGRIIFPTSKNVDPTEPNILVAKDTSPKDIDLINKSVGVVTTKGGFTCHAAVVARGMGKTCVVGVNDLIYKPNKKVLTTKNGDTVLVEGDWITVDGSTGRIWLASGIIDYGVENTTEIKNRNELLRLLFTYHDLHVRGFNEPGLYGAPYYHGIFIDLYNNPGQVLLNYGISGISEADTVLVYFDSMVYYHEQDNKLASIFGENVYPVSWEGVLKELQELDKSFNANVVINVPDFCIPGFIRHALQSRNIKYFTTVNAVDDLFKDHKIFVSKATLKLPGSDNCLDKLMQVINESNWISVRVIPDFIDYRQALDKCLDAEV